MSAHKMLYLTSYENDTPLLLITLCRKLTVFCNRNKSLPKKGKEKEKRKGFVGEINLILD